jgi:hypothetical protein
LLFYENFIHFSYPELRLINKVNQVNTLINRWKTKTGRYLLAAGFFYFIFLLQLKVKRYIKKSTRQTNRNRIHHTCIGIGDPLISNCIVDIESIKNLNP